MLSYLKITTYLDIQLTKIRKFTKCRETHWVPLRGQERGEKRPLLRGGRVLHPSESMLVDFKSFNFGI